MRKPELEFFQFVLKEFSCSAEETVMIGDDVKADILGALDANIGGIPVKTSKYRDACLQNRARCMTLQLQ